MIVIAVPSFSRMPSEPAFPSGGIEARGGLLLVEGGEQIADDIGLQGFGAIVTRLFAAVPCRS